MRSLAALARALEDYVPLVLDATKTPGITVAITDRDGEGMSFGYGRANLADDMPMLPDAVMPGGSMSKPYVTVAVMQLAERGIIDIHEPVTRYVKDLLVRNPFGMRAVTAYDLMTHQSGLATDTYDASLEAPSPLAEYLAEGFGRIASREYCGAGVRWTAPVGGRYQYSSFGMATLGYLVETVRGQRFSDYVNDEIFAPLEMLSTCIPERHAGDSVPADILARRATGYARFGEWCVPTPAIQSATYPACSVLITAADHCRFLTAVLRGGELNGARILEPATIQTILTPQRFAQILEPTPGLYCGLGLHMRHLGHDHYYVGHPGAFPFGWWGDSRAYPHLGFTITALSNAWDMSRYVNPFDRIAPGLIADFAERWMSKDAPPMDVAKPHIGLDSQVSYAAGLLLGERIRGLLGVDSILSPDSIDAMVGGTRPLSPEPTDSWNADRFAAGVTAMNELEPSPRAIRSFLAHRSDVSIDELRLAALRIGASRATFPMPMQFWADQTEADKSLLAHLNAIGPNDPGRITG